MKFRKRKDKTKAEEVLDRLNDRKAQREREEQESRERREAELKAEAICYPYWWDGKRQAEKPPTEPVEGHGTLTIEYFDGSVFDEPITSVSRYVPGYLGWFGEGPPPWRYMEVYELSVSRGYRVTDDEITVQSKTNQATYTREGMRSYSVEWEE